MRNENTVLEGDSSNRVRLYLDRIRRGKWLVVAVGVVAASVAYVVGVSSPTTFTVWATLSTATANRSPEQDGVLASGYVDYFNSSGYQNKLKAAESIPGDVSLHARTAAASPIIYIEATATSQSVAETMAPKAALEFTEDVNSHLRQAQDETISAVRKPFDDARLANGVVSEVSLDQLQNQINQITANSTNRLMSLQMESGVSKTSPEVWPGALLALLGGLIVGCVLAVLAGAASRRLPNSPEVDAKVGLSPIVELPEVKSPGSRRLYAYRVQQLVNGVALAGLPDKATVVVTSTMASDAGAHIARRLAEGRAAQGVPTMLVNADLHRPDGVGFGDLITAEPIHLDSVLTTLSPNLTELKSGRVSSAPFAMVTDSRSSAALDQLREHADFIVVIAPPITEAAESQVLCSVADGVLLVIDSKSSRVPDATEATAILRSFKAPLLGAVLTNVSRRTSVFSKFGDRKRKASSAAAVHAPATAMVARPVPVVAEASWADLTRVAGYRP